MRSTWRQRCLTLLIVSSWIVSADACRQPPAATPTPSSTPSEVEKEIAALKADVEVLKGKAPSASVAMADVGFHFSNLWFAGQSGNWPLAGYYFSEARNHVRWLTRINPMPKGPDGMPVDVTSIFDAIDTTTFADVKTAIDKKDGRQFEKAYRGALESCYQCHKAVGRPYLRPMIPKSLPQTIVNLDAGANWPQ
jgi:cytochrome c553